MKRALFVAAVLALIPGTSSVFAYASVSTTKVATVRAARISLRYPNDWSVVDPPANLPDVKRYFKRFPEAAAMIGIDPSDSAKAISKLLRHRLKVVKFTAVDLTGSGDILNVSVEPGPWYSGLGEWQAMMQLSARSTNGTVLASDETRIGSRQAFTHLEEYDDPPGHSLIFGYMEIRAQSRMVIEIGITVDLDQRDEAEAILASVSASAR